jgi:hypothetical protein
VNRVGKGLRNKKKVGGLWANVPFFLPRSRTGEGGRGASVRRRAAASRGRRRPGTGGKGGGGRGLTILVLTLVSDGLRRCLRGKGRPAVEMGGGGANGGVAVRLSATGSSRLGWGAARRGAGLL